MVSVRLLALQKSLFNHGTGLAAIAIYVMLICLLRKCLKYWLLSSKSAFGLQGSSGEFGLGYQSHKR
ncbi:hypothetical protein O9993_07900 [Vibrio lentus]|nr:hypothetical protein [Vibrio lentus]